MSTRLCKIACLLTWVLPSLFAGCDALSLDWGQTRNWSTPLTANQPELNAWAADEMLTLTRDSSRPRWSDVYHAGGDGRRVRLFGGANETLSFQLVIDAGNEPVRD
ncbi:MAG: hypothetical protein ACOC93_05705, partial [Planctomycetota bacterium]